VKATLLPTAVQNGARQIPMVFGFALVVTFLQLNANAQDVNLGTANNFAVLACSAVSSTGNTVITGGNVGLYPDTLSSVTGFYPPGIVTAPGIIEAANGATLQAQNDLTAAYSQAAGLAPSSNLTGQDLGGLTLTPGVYFFSSSAGLTGQLTLNDLGNPDAVFVFQIGSTLTTASGSKVVTINDPSTAGISVFWQVGSSATLGTGTSFEGSILANTSITDNGGSTVEGRLLAETGAVTLNDTVIDVPPAEVIGGGGGTNVPDGGTTLLLLGFGVLSLLAFFEAGGRSLILTQDRRAIS
jgi:hypothetical protein